MTYTDKCPRLQEPSNGKILYQLQTSYVGSEVIYQCDDQSKEISRKCLYQEAYGKVLLLSVKVSSQHINLIHKLPVNSHTLLFRRT